MHVMPTVATQRIMHTVRFCCILCVGGWQYRHRSQELDCGISCGGRALVLVHPRAVKGAAAARPQTAAASPQAAASHQEASTAIAASQAAVLASPQEAASTAVEALGAEALAAPATPAASAAAAATPSALCASARQTLL